jgi:hypothetical protein
MATIHQAQKRITSRYKACAEHLNAHEILMFSFKEVNNGKQYWDVNARSGEVEYDAGYTRYLRITTSIPVTRDQLIETLFIYQHDCSCEHDCCGHFTGGAVTSRVRNLSKLHDGTRPPFRRAKFGTYQPKRYSNGVGRHWLVPIHYSPNL